MNTRSIDTVFRRLHELHHARLDMFAPRGPERVPFILRPEGLAGRTYRVLPIRYQPALYRGWFIHCIHHVWATARVLVGPAPGEVVVVHFYVGGASCSYTDWMREHHERMLDVLRAWQPGVEWTVRYSRLASR